MTHENNSKTAFARAAHHGPGKRRAVIGALTGLAVAATLTVTTVPALAGDRAPEAATTKQSARHHLSPLQVASAFYASYNGDLQAGFDRYISKNLLLHGFNGPEDRKDWIKGDLNIKEGLEGFKMTVLDQIVEGNRVVTRWSFEGVHKGTVFGIPASGRPVQLSGISIDRVIDGKSVEHWSEGNFGVFLDALRGITPPGSVKPDAA